MYRPYAHRPDIETEDMAGLSPQIKFRKLHINEAKDVNKRKSVF
jgi:hypothetical protein